MKAGLNKKWWFAQSRILFALLSALSVAALSSSCRHDRSGTQESGAHFNQIVGKQVQLDSVKWARNDSIRIAKELEKNRHMMTKYGPPGSM